MEHLRQIEFKQELGGKKIKRRGIQVGDWLVVAFSYPDDNSSYRIFKIHDGKPALDATFSSSKDAMNIAKLMNDTYKDYFDIWLTMPDADIMELTQWTIKNGIDLYKIAKEMSKKPIVSEFDVKQLLTSYRAI